MCQATVLSVLHVFHPWDKLYKGSAVLHPHTHTHFSDEETVLHVLQIVEFKVAKLGLKPMLLILLPHNRWSGPFLLDRV